MRIIFYNQNILRLISCLNKQGVKTILVDNNSDNKQIIGELKKSNEAIIIELSSNTGIANAQNIGSDYAIKIKAEFIESPKSQKYELALTDILVKAIVSDAHPAESVISKPATTTGLLLA